MIAVSPTIIASIVDVAMDDEFWAKQPQLQKQAEVAAPVYDDGFVDIGGVKIPKKALYGMALGGLAGGAGGIAGKLSPQTIALLVALGAAGGGVTGGGLHLLDTVTESDTPGVSRADAAKRAAGEKARAADIAAKSGGAATQLARGLAGEPSNALVELGGTGAQVAGGAYLGNTMQRVLRAQALSKLLRERAGIDIQTIPGADASAKNSTAIRRLIGAKGLSDIDIAEIAKAHGAADVARVNSANAPPSTTVSGRVKQLLEKADRKLLGTAAPMPWDLTKQRMPSVDLAETMSRNFAPATTAVDAASKAAKLDPTRFVGRNRLGTIGGAALALLPSLGAFSSSTSAEGVGPAASLVNHLRGRW